MRASDDWEKGISDETWGHGLTEEQRRKFERSRRYNNRLAVLYGVAMVLLISSLWLSGKL